MLRRGSITTRGSARSSRCTGRSTSSSGRCELDVDRRFLQGPPVIVAIERSRQGRTDDVPGRVRRGHGNEDRGAVPDRRRYAGAGSCARRSAPPVASASSTSAAARLLLRRAGRGGGAVRVGGRRRLRARRCSSSPPAAPGTERRARLQDAVSLPVDDASFDAAVRASARVRPRPDGGPGRDAPSPSTAGGWSCGTSTGRRSPCTLDSASPSVCCAPGTSTSPTPPCRAHSPRLRAAGFEEVRMQAHPFSTCELDPDTYGARPWSRW